MDKLQELFLKCEKEIKNKNYNILIVNKSLFKQKHQESRTDECYIYGVEGAVEIKEYFEFNDEMVVNYTCDYFVYKWLKDHKDLRYKNFSIVLEPLHIIVDLKDISFNEFLCFISPETKRTNYGFPS